MWFAPCPKFGTALKGQRAGVTRHPSQPTSWTSPSHGITPEHGCIARGHQGVPFDEDFQVHEEVLGTQNKTFAFSSWHLCKIDSHITEPGEQLPRTLGSRTEQAKARRGRSIGVVFRPPTGAGRGQ